MTADCHLKKPSAHQSRALVVLTMIRLLAYTLSLLFYPRQVLSHRSSHAPATFREFARNLRLSCDWLDSKGRSLASSRSLRAWLRIFDSTSLRDRWAA